MRRTIAVSLALCLLSGCSTYREYRPRVDTLYLQDGTEGYSIKIGRAHV